MERKKGCYLLELVDGRQLRGEDGVVGVAARKGDDRGVGVWRAVEAELELGVEAVGAAELDERVLA
eukprot:838470-Rhodomonas_salina.1